MAIEGRNSTAIYNALSVEDVQRSADELHAVYASTNARDGYVSLEVNPRLAHDTDATITDARRLWALVNRPNLLVKVPATQEGLQAIQQLVAEGINVNATLLFGLSRYRQVAEAYINGIEARVVRRLPVERVSSVASFFVSRVDTLLDSRLESLDAKGDRAAVPAGKLRGRIATANGKLAYQIYKEIFTGQRFARLAERGARRQRLLWASTSTKNPAYSDVKYVEELIGSDTVNTLPMETLRAYRDHGEPRVRLEGGLAGARSVLRRLCELGIDMDQAAQQLEDEGVAKFSQAFDGLIAALEKVSARLGCAASHASGT
jgi:transaldolase